MPNLDFQKPITLTFHNGSVYTLAHGVWCDSNGIPCDEGTAEYMQNLLDFAEWEDEEDSLMAEYMQNLLDFAELEAEEDSLMADTSDILDF